MHFAVALCWFHEILMHILLRGRQRTVGLSFLSFLQFWYTVGWLVNGILKCLWLSSFAHIFCAFVYDQSLLREEEVDPNNHAVFRWHSVLLLLMHRISLSTTYSAYDWAANVCIWPLMHLTLTSMCFTQGEIFLLQSVDLLLQDKGKWWIESPIYQICHVQIACRSRHVPQERTSTIFILISQPIIQNKVR